MSSTRSLTVHMFDRLAGTLNEIVSADGKTKYVFEYAQSYQGSLGAVPVSSTLPIAKTRHEAPRLFPFFDGLIPEGWLHQTAITELGLNPKDRFRLLGELCGDAIGAASVSTRHEESQPTQNEGTSKPDTGVPVLTLDALESTIRPQLSFCIHCARPLEKRGANGNYHPECALQLFGQDQPPIFDLTEKTFEREAAKALKSKFSLTGVQAKFSAQLISTQKRKTYVFPGRYILKPEPKQLPSLAHAEHFAMLYASLLGIDSAKSGIGYLRTGKAVYVTKRFDRDHDGAKIHIEDFHQLTDVAHETAIGKYNSSLERVVDTIADTCGITAPTSSGRFVEACLYNYLIGNADNHLKNFSIRYQESEGESKVELAPLYDLVPIKLVYPADDEETGLTLAGKKRKLQRQHFGELAKRANYPMSRLDDLLSRFAKTVKPLYFAWLDELGLKDEVLSKYKSGVQDRIKTIEK
ncbi:MAG: serine/threonine-protein kinase HipA [Planctomycetota bacterium]|jgi:serine/threonine-protein kinase HipA